MSAEDAPPPRLRALLFDFDGTIAETERHGHRVAYNAAFEELGLPWRWDEALYGELLAVAGGKERLVAYIEREWPALFAGRDVAAEAERIHLVKQRHFARIGKAIPLRSGVRRLVLEAKAHGVRVAIVTTAAPAGVDAVLAQDPPLRAAFDLIAAGDAVARKKPAPDIYEWALARLDVAPSQALSIEDSRIGLQASLAAGVRTLVTPSLYAAGEDFGGAAAVLSGLGEPDAPVSTIAGSPPETGYVDIHYACTLLAR